MAVSGGRRVQVYAKSTAVSETPVRPGKMYPLSVLDQAMANHTIRLVFYYRAGPTMERDRLKESLSEVLSYYPAMTGRLTRAAAEEGGGSEWVVKCNDAGVRQVDAKVGLTLDEWLRSATDEEETELAYWEPMGTEPDIWSPYYIQITEFADKAFAVGLSCPHMHADPSCAILFIRAWSDLHRRACIAYPPFFHPPALVPRPVPNPSSTLLSVKSAAPITTTSTKMTSATFVFSDAAVKSCLAEVDHPDASPFDALAALFWYYCVASPHGAGNSSLTLCLDFRKRMHAPLPYGFYGNSFLFTLVQADLGAGLRQAADAVHRHVSGVREEEFWEALEWLHERQRCRGGAFQMYGPELTCLALDHAFSYGAAFEGDGVGQPAHVTCRLGGVEGEGLIVVMPAAAEEGSAARAVTVTLPEEVTARIIREEAIMKYRPTVIFAAARV